MKIRASDLDDFQPVQQAQQDEQSHDNERNAMNTDECRAVAAMPMQASLQNTGVAPKPARKKLSASSFGDFRATQQPSLMGMVSGDGSILAPDTSTVNVAGKPARHKLSAASFGDFRLSQPSPLMGLTSETASNTTSSTPAVNSAGEPARHKLSAASFGDFNQAYGNAVVSQLNQPANDGKHLSQPNFAITESKELSSTDLASSTGGQEVFYSSAATGGQDIPHWRFICLSLSLCIGLFLSFLDGSITATALYTIGVEFNTLTSITWIAVAYTLADVGFATLFTALADIIGRFNAYLLAQTIFLAFSFACGFAQSLTQLIVFRAFEGIGGSGLYSLAMVIWPEMSTLALKKWIGAFVGLVVAAAGVAGPLVGGVITNDISWRWIFWINPPIVVVSTALFVIAWPRSERVREHERKGISSLDIKGAMLLAAGCVLPVLAFEEVGSHVDPWKQGIFIGPLVAGIGSWIILVVWEFRITLSGPASRFNPIFPPKLLGNRRYAANAANSLLIGFLFFVAIYFVPLHMQTVNGKSPLAAGVALLPMLISSAFGAFLAGALSSGMDLLCPTIVTGSALITLGTGLLSTLSSSVHVEAKVYGFQVLVGLGFGLTVSSSSILANVECELKDHAVAQGIVAQARVFGGSFGISAATAILGLKTRSQLGATGILSPNEMQSLFAASKSLSSEQLQAVRHTYADAFSETMKVAAIVGCIAFLSAIATWDASKIPLPNRIVLQEQREDERIATLMREKYMASRVESMETGTTTRLPAYQHSQV